MCPSGDEINEMFAKILNLRISSACVTHAKINNVDKVNSCGETAGRDESNEVFAKILNSEFHPPA